MLRLTETLHPGQMFTKYLQNAKYLSYAATPSACLGKGYLCFLRFSSEGWHTQLSYAGTPPAFLAQDCLCFFLQVFFRFSQEGFLKQVATIN